MRTKLAIAACVGLAVSGWASAASAHHAFAAEFDANKPVNFKGTITKMEWVNPHTWLHISVQKNDGSAEAWAIEAGTPNVLFRRGFTRETLPVGLEIVVDVPVDLVARHGPRDGLIEEPRQGLGVAGGEGLVFGMRCGGVCPPERSVQRDGAQLEVVGVGEQVVEVDPAEERIA